MKEGEGMNEKETWIGWVASPRSRRQAGWIAVSWLALLVLMAWRGLGWRELFLMLAACGFANNMSRWTEDRP